MNRSFTLHWDIFGAEVRAPFWVVIVDTSQQYQTLYSAQRMARESQEHSGCTSTARRSWTRGKGT